MKIILVFIFVTNLSKYVAVGALGRSYGAGIENILCIFLDIRVFK